MRSVLLLLTAALMAPAAGCTGFKGLGGGAGPRPTGPVEEVQAERLASYLTAQAGVLRSLEYEDVDVRVSGRGVMAANLRGNLAAAQPRNFRLVAEPRVAGKVDLGSNPDGCWLYMKVPGSDPEYVAATHADFQSGRARLPGGLQFDPEWVMQALNLTPPPADAQLAVKTSQRDRTYTLSWPATGPGGQPVRKEVVFDADTAVGDRPQVKKHLVWDDRGRKLIASAEVKSAQAVPLGAAAQYPTRVALKWTDQFEMDLDLRARPARVNELTPENAARQAEFQARFTRPDRIYQMNPIDLARYETRPTR